MADSLGLPALDLGIASLHEAYRGGRLTPEDAVREVYRRIRARGDDHVWISLVDESVALARARELSRDPGAIASLPLYGIPFSVKDNIDVAGMRTTCGCDGYLREPDTNAVAVQKALDAGAILIGKNSLDQFATGLNGTRTMGGHCVNALDPCYVPGGSSSGSGVAVAAELVSFSIGSDTGGSGRVPAAMNNVVGVKPSVGLVSGTGMVHNHRLIDCVPVLARNVADGYAVLEAIRGYDSADIASREDAGILPLDVSGPQQFRFALPRSDQLEFFGDAMSGQAFARSVELMRSIGGSPVEIDFEFFLRAGRLPFESGLLAERALGYRDVLDSAPDTVHPAVAQMIRKGLAYSGTEALEALFSMMSLRREARDRLRDVDVLLTPTVGRAYTCEEMKREPIAFNTNNGYYTYFVNPLDLCALAVPACMRTDGLPFGISLVAPAGADGLLKALGTRFEGAAKLAPGIRAARNRAGG